MKITIICSDFKKSNIRKLPWKYIYEIAKNLSKNHEISIITDVPADLPEFKIITIEKLFIPFKGESEELLKTIEELSPDKCIMLLGLTSFLRREFQIKKPVMGIFTSPLYSFRELIKNVGIFDLIRYRAYTFIHILNSLTPNYFVSKWSNHFEKIIFLSHDTERKLIKKGFSEEKAVFIPCGIDEEFFHKPDPLEVNEIKRKLSPDGKPIIMYFTAPLTLRGTDTLIKAFAKVKKDMDCKLVFLSRIDYDESLKEQAKLKKLAIKKNVQKDVEFLSDYLIPQEIKIYLSAADLICLPFKIVISDIPISIIEAQVLGKTVISTDVVGINEFVDEKYLIQPENYKELGKVLKNQLTSDFKNDDYKFFSWEETNENLEKLINM